MGVRSIDEINREFLEKKGAKKVRQGRIPDILFWLFVFLLLVALLSFNNNSFATRPVFGYSLYITNEESNLLLVKNGHGLKQRLIYDELPRDVDIGIIKASFPKLGKTVHILTDKIYVVLILSGIWLFVQCYGNKMFNGSIGKGVKK